MTLKEQEFIEQVVPGLRVVSHRSLGMASGLAVGDLEPTVAFHEARQVNTPEADALFLSGTNWRTIEVIEAMELDLGKSGFYRQPGDHVGHPAQAGHPA